MRMDKMQAFAELESGIGEAQPADRPRLRKLLRSIRDAQRTGKPFDRNLARLTADVERSAAVRRTRIAGVPAISFDDELPISARRDEIAAAIR
ncbi:MAG TPA: hypothetical protein VHB77_06795, partial [Planctomycetaceae bacterium]|nr:hypothetical protein [Planctomycetaceae bacterium]